MLEAFKRHLEQRFVSQMINDFVLDVASALVDRHALRAYDAVQLAGYVALRGSTGTDVPVFVCSGHSLVEAARLYGISILDPAPAPYNSMSFRVLLSPDCCVAFAFISLIFLPLTLLG